MRKLGKSLGCQRGAGLLEILIMSGILLVVIQFMMQSFTNFKGYQKHKKLQMSYLFLKSYLNNSVDCEKTISNAGGSCSVGDDIEIASTSSNSPILIRIGSEDEMNFRKVGPYLVRAQCGTGGTINVEAMLVNKKKKQVEHPIYKTKGWISLYEDDIPFKCTF